MERVILMPFLIAEDEKAFERLYENMRREFKKLAKKILDAESEKGELLSEDEIKLVIKEWLEEIENDS
jgi:hypothetical protein